MSSLQLSWIYKEKESIVLRSFLKENSISKQALTDIKYKGGKITVNGKEETVRYLLQQHDEVTVEFPKEERSESLTVQDNDLSILYEDEYFLICNKQPEMNTIPSREWPKDSLANYCLGYYEKIGLKSAIHMVNRLDRDTSGALIIAKYRHIHHLFSLQQKSIDLKRTYIAIVEGKLSMKKGTINEPIGRKNDSIIERMVRSDGQHAVTHYEVVAECNDYSLVSIILETGRTHQIRVHFAHIHHPLVGDSLYGGDTSELSRQALHSFEVEGIHPITQKIFRCNAPLPNDISQFIEKHFK